MKGRCKVRDGAFVFIKGASHSFDEKQPADNTNRMAVQNTNVNVAAITARATPACAARVDTVPMSPPAELLVVDVDGLLGVSVVAGVRDEVLDKREVDDVGDVVLRPFVLEVDGPEEEMPEEVPLVPGGDKDEPVVLPPVMYDGAGTAFDGSASAPVPQGICCPLGWAAFGGGTVAPAASAMANRPVHVRFGEAGEVNW